MVLMGQAMPGLCRGLALVEFRPEEDPRHGRPRGGITLSPQFFPPNFDQAMGAPYRAASWRAVELRPLLGRAGHGAGKCCRHDYSSYPPRSIV